MKNVKKTIEAKVSNMKVVEMRAIAPTLGIKDASKFKREELSQMLIDKMVEAEKAKLEKAKQKAKKSTTSKPSKRVKAERVEDDEVKALAKELLDGIEMLGEKELMQVNRKVLIEVMKTLHCSKWYRTYDKKTMVEKILKTA